LHQRQSIKCHTISSSTKLHQSKQLQSQVQQVFIPLIEQSFETNTKWSSTNQITPPYFTAFLPMAYWALLTNDISYSTNISSSELLDRSSFAKVACKNCPIKVHSHSVETGFSNSKVPLHIWTSGCLTLCKQEMIVLMCPVFLCKLMEDYNSSEAWESFHLMQKHSYMVGTSFLLS